MTNSAGGCHYLPSGLWLLTLPCRAPPPFGQYQITLSGYKGTCVCVCVNNLPSVVTWKKYLYNWCKCNEDNVSNNETDMLHSKSINTNTSTLSAMECHNTVTKCQKKLRGCHFNQVEAATDSANIYEMPSHPQQQCLASSDAGQTWEAAAQQIQ